MALTDAQLDELNDFLLSDDTPEETMDIEMLDGFLVAITIGPEEIADTEWLPQVFGGEIPASATAEMLGLIRAYAKDIADKFAPKRRENMGDEPLYYPLVLEPEELDTEDTEEEWADHLGEFWASGFRGGMLMRQEMWVAFINEDNDFGDDVNTIGMLEFGCHPERQSEGLTRDMREKLLEELPWIVEDIMTAWLNRKFGHVETVVKNAPKIGRNDPCPCGSGKKYKKCCGK